MEIFIMEKDKITIYVLVYVHYDWYRFQENYCASTNKEEVLCYLKKHPHAPGDFPDKILPVYEYSDDDIPEDLRDKEIRHWWIQKFEEKL